MKNEIMEFVHARIQNYGSDLAFLAEKGLKTQFGKTYSREHLSRVYHDWLKKKGIDKAAPPKPSIAQLANWDIFTEWLKSEQMKKWSSNINRLTKIWLQSLARKDLNNLEETDIPRFFNWLEEQKTNEGQKWSQSKKRDYVLALRTWCRRFKPLLLVLLPTDKYPKTSRELSFLSETWINEKLPSFLDEVERLGGKFTRYLCELKICTFIRTGDKTEQRELAGLRKGVGAGKSWIAVNDGVASWHVFAKKNEIWDTLIMPKHLHEWLRGYLENIQVGDVVFTSEEIERLRECVKKAGKNLGIPDDLTLHDLRKIGLTWYCVNGIGLEYAVSVNVGWKDITTAKNHYLYIKGISKSLAQIDKFSFSTQKDVVKAD